MRCVQREGQTIVIPTGWKEVEEDDLVCKDDRYFNLYSRKFARVESDDFNMPSNGFTCLIRKES